MARWLLTAVLFLIAGSVAGADELQNALDRAGACLGNIGEKTQGAGPCRTPLSDHRPRPPQALAPLRSVDQAAIAFVDYARSAMPDQRVEYCSYIVKIQGGFMFTPPSRGDINHCPLGVMPADAAASVHTHPIWGPPDDLSSSGQMFSEHDFNTAVRMPAYLGGPAGQVLRSDPGSNVCRGDMVKHAYVIVRPPKSGAHGELPFKPTEFVYTAGGKNQPYCTSGATAQR